MGVYVFIAIWSVLIGAFVLQNRNRSYEKNRKSYMFLLSCVLAIIMGLRATTVGQDTLSYKNMFDTVSSIPIDMLFNISSYSSKIGYVLLMKVCSYIVNDYFFFQIVVSVLFCIGISKFLLDHGRDMLLITMVFLGCGFYLSAFNVTREAIAVVLVVNAFTAIEEQKWKQAVILFLLAISIHLTALSFLWGVVIYIFKDKEWIIKWAPIFTMIVGLGYEIVIELASKFFPMYFNYYKNYQSKHSVDLGAVVWAVIVVFSLFCIYEKKKFTSVEKVYANFSLIYIMANIVGLYFNHFQRLGTYFLPFSIILVERVGMKIRNKEIRIIYKLGVSVCYMAYFLLRASTKQYRYDFFF